MVSTAHFNKPIPLALYIHIPWCIRKCPYCDFNSHAVKEAIPEESYLQALIRDLEADLDQIPLRPIQSIFIGGGTPSLFSPDALAALLEAIAARVALARSLEVTLEANPGTVEQTRFVGFRQAGINRLSLGIQSFQPEKLKVLGRIHDDQEAVQAVMAAKQAGFENFNLDLMFGLPNQSLEDALFDLNTALSLKPTHLSWYQLTIEPNTLFYHRKPPLPADDDIWEIQHHGQALLASHGFHQYEISAYSQFGFQSRHNLNYWEFGDYLGIGAGAHAKITNPHNHTITRFWKTKHPKEYLNPDKSFLAGQQTIPVD